jgi:hypothetical protein
MPVVSALAKTMIDTGDLITQQVKAWAPLGSGNNHPVHLGPCVSSQATSIVLDGQNTMTKAKDGSTVTNDWNRPMRRSAYVLRFGAGNCQDLAALAYCYCRDYFLETAQVQFVVNRGFGHAYVIVTMGSEQVVVDPWPLYAQSMMVADHFCGLNYQEVQKEGPGLVSGTTLKLTKASRVQTALARSQTVQWTPNNSFACTREYTHQFGAKSKGWLSYTTS